MHAVAHTHTHVSLILLLAHIGSYINGVCNMEDSDPETIRNTMPRTTHAIPHPGPQINQPSVSDE